MEKEEKKNDIEGYNLKEILNRKIKQKEPIISLNDLQNEVNIIKRQISDIQEELRTLKFQNNIIEKEDNEDIIQINEINNVKSQKWITIVTINIGSHNIVTQALIDTGADFNCVR